MKNRYSTNILPQYEQSVNHFRKTKATGYMFLLYISETWCLSKVPCGKINPLEMWIYRRMYKMSYTDHIYIIRGEPYLCSAKAPVLDGSGSRR